MYRGGKIDLKQIQAFTKRDGVTFISLIKEQGRLGPGWQCVLRTWRSVLQSTSGSNLCDSTWQSHKFTAFHMIYAYIYIYVYILLSESNGVATEIMPGTPPALTDLCEIIETTRPTVRFEA